MKYNLPPRVVGPRGMTLLELTVVILFLLSLIAIMFVGARAWRHGSARASCIMNLRNVQVATRSYQNLYGYQSGDQPSLDYGTQDIARHLLGKGFISQNLYDQAREGLPCSGGGNYSSTAPDFFPKQGVLYIQCSLSAADEHAPDASTVANW